jgi:hypothetical protein
MSAVTKISQRDSGWWMVLVACMITVLMAAIDAGILNLIEPTIQLDLNATQSTIGEQPGA